MKQTNLWLAPFVILVLSGCLVTRQEVRNSVKSDPITPEQQRRATTEVRYQELEEQLRQMNGRLEVVENSINMLNADKTGSSSESLEDKKILNERLRIYEEALGKLESQIVNLTQKLETLQSSSTKSSSTNAPLNSYDEASKQFNNKRWKESIVAFEKYRTLNPKGLRYSEATYKIAAAFQELGMKAEARAFYSEVVEKSPKSDWAQKARGRLKSLN